MKEEKKPLTTPLPHSITIDSRKRGIVSGVEKVITTCETIISLQTSCGVLLICGSELRINKYSVDDGNLSYEGKTDNIKYNTKSKGFLKRILK